MARRLFPCLYPLEPTECSEDAITTHCNQLINESTRSQNSFPFCVPTTSSICCCHLTLNPKEKQQYATGNGHPGYLSLVKCQSVSPVALALELVCQACNASDGCLIRYLELRMQKQGVQGESSLVVLGEVNSVSLSYP